MNLFRKWFGREERGEARDEPYREYTLDQLQVGCLVDYDLKTWEVIGYSTCDYDGFMTQEWVLRAGDEVGFLGRACEDGVSTWTLTWKVPLEELQEDVAGAIAERDDPPEEIHYQGRGYTGVATSAGLKREGDSGTEREFVEWSYESAEGDMLLVSQWGERSFAARAGRPVEEYQFTDILPGPPERSGKS